MIDSNNGYPRTWRIEIEIYYLENTVIIGTIIIGDNNNNNNDNNNDDE